MVLKCHSCGAALNSDSEAGGGTIECPFCGSHNRVTVDPPERTPGARPIVPLPESLRVEDSFGELKITRRWYSPMLFLLVFFCIGWDTFLVVWYIIAFTTDAPWFMAVFPVFHLAVGVGLTYSTIAGFVNRTVVSVRNGELRVWHGPLPWMGNQVIDATEVEQLYCDKTIHKGKNGTRTTYSLYALRNGGRRTKLVSGLTDSAIALSMERLIEDHLKVQDRPVSGELVSKNPV